MCSCDDTVWCDSELCVLALTEKTFSVSVSVSAGRRSLWRLQTVLGMSCRSAGRRRSTPLLERTMSTTTQVSSPPSTPLPPASPPLRLCNQKQCSSSSRENPAGGPAGPVAAGAGVHAAGLPGRGQWCSQRSEGDLSGEGAEASSSAAGVPAAQRRLEGQVNVSDELWVRRTNRGTVEKIIYSVTKSRNKYYIYNNIIIVRTNKNKLF